MVGRRASALIAYAVATSWLLPYAEDREVMLAEVQKDGLALRLASSELQHDREVVLAAVRRHGGALEFASSELQHDREVRIGRSAGVWGRAPACLL